MEVTEYQSDRLVERVAWETPELVRTELEEIESAADLDILFACWSSGNCDAG